MEVESKIKHRTRQHRSLEVASLDLGVRIHTTRGFLFLMTVTSSTMVTSWTVVSSSVSIMCLGIYPTHSFTISFSPPPTPPSAAMATAVIAASSTPDALPRKASRAVASVLHEGGSQKEREGERKGKGKR